MIQRSERFTKAYDSLVRAFFEGTLAKGTCVGCACGNIIFDAIKLPVTAEDMRLQCMGSDRAMQKGLYTNRRRKIDAAHELWAKHREITPARPFIAEPEAESIGRVNEAGYTTEEFAEIEMAFETATTINYLDYPYKDEQRLLEDQYKGLCAVVDVLLKLEGEIQGGDELKAKFREHPSLV